MQRQNFLLAKLTELKFFIEIFFNNLYIVSKPLGNNFKEKALLAMRYAKNSGSQCYKNTIGR